ncbi:MAG: hypothetical protein R2849_05755 [Thermomicrobiales bacterium]
MSYDRERSLCTFELATAHRVERMPSQLAGALGKPVEVDGVLDAAPRATAAFRRQHRKRHIRLGEFLLRVADIAGPVNRGKSSSSAVRSTSIARALSISSLASSKSARCAARTVRAQPDDLPRFGQRPLLPR